MDETERQGAFARYTLVKVEELLRIPDGLSLRHAALAEGAHQQPEEDQEAEQAAISDCPGLHRRLYASLPPAFRRSAYNLERRV
mgnify:CR=1 FL=1